MPDPSADADLWSSGHRLTVLGWGYLNPSNTVYSAELRRAEEKVADNAITFAATSRDDEDELRSWLRYTRR
jgi:hypothetical protein